MSVLAKLFHKQKKKLEYKRIQCNSVTEVLAEAMENADRMKTVIVLYETKEGENSDGGFILQHGVTVSAMNWMIDQFKAWLVS